MKYLDGLAIFFDSETYYQTDNQEEIMAIIHFRINKLKLEFSADIRSSQYVYLIDFFHDDIAKSLYKQWEQSRNSFIAWRESNVSDPARIDCIERGCPDYEQHAQNTVDYYNELQGSDEFYPTGSVFQREGVARDLANIYGYNYHMPSKFEERFDKFIERNEGVNLKLNAFKPTEFGDEKYTELRDRLHRSTLTRCQENCTVGDRVNRTHTEAVGNYYLRLISDDSFFEEVFGYLEKDRYTRRIKSYQSAEEKSIAHDFEVIQ
jgi:hypothetical protein